MPRRDAGPGPVAPRPAAARPAAPRRWMSLEEASGLLGISATTLRRWSDTGVIETFVTPGGHRRYDAASVEALLPGAPARPTMEHLGETPERMSKAYRRVGDRKGLPWIGSLDDEQRTAFREHGRRVATELLAALDASTDVDRATHITRASEAAAQYGVSAGVRGLPTSATVEAFLRFRRPFLVELASGARRRALDAAAATDLLTRASDAFDQLLVATVLAHEEALTATEPPDAPLPLPDPALPLGVPGAPVLHPEHRP